MKFLFLFILTLCSFLPIEAAEIDIDEVINAGLPVLLIETINHEEPSFTKADKPQGCWGVSIANVTKVPGRLQILTGGGILYDSGEYVEKESGMTIKVRGNQSTWNTEKYPYKIKLQKKADLLNRGDEKFNDKNWVLIKDEELNAMIGFKVNSLMNLHWTPSYMYVNVVMNDSYRGVYMLLESVERNTKCRLNVSKSGYIFELDPYWWNEDKYFLSSFYEPVNYTFKYPDSDDVTEEQYDYIQNVVKVAELSLNDGTYSDYIDLDSFSSWVLGHDILGNDDSAGANMFYTKYDDTDTSKIMMANMWDFDKIMRTEGKWDESHRSFYFAKLFKSDNKEFIKAFKNKWNSVKETVFIDIQNYLDEFETSETASAYNRSLEMDGIRYGKENRSVSESLEFARKWFIAREMFLKAEIPLIDDGGETTSIEAYKENHRKNIPMSKYTVTGQKVSAHYKGIVIGNGVKYKEK